MLRLNPNFDQKRVLVTENTVVNTGSTSSYGYRLQFKGGLKEVNDALDLFEYKPECPFENNN